MKVTDWKIRGSIHSTSFAPAVVKPDPGKSEKSAR
jgi:hypothetical protein